MPRNGANIYSKPAGTTAVTTTLIESAKYNSTIDDLVTDANTPRPVIAGGTGASTLTGLLAALGGQPVDGALTSIAGLVYAADQGIHATGIDTFAVHTQTAFARTLLDDTTAANARTTLGAQAADADLDALAALATTGLISRTGAGTVAARSITSTDASVTITNPDGVAGNINLSVPVGTVTDAALDTGVATAAGTTWAGLRTAGLAAGAVGSYMLASNQSLTPASITAGTNVAGSSLLGATALGGTTAGALSGTWRTMGRCSTNASGVISLDSDARVTLFLRIS